MAQSASGKVKTLYPNETATFIEIDYEGEKPRENYFRLNKSHPNYDSLYSLALTAAVNRYTLTIRIKRDEEITQERYAEILYLVVRW